MKNVILIAAISVWSSYALAQTVADSLSNKRGDYSERVVALSTWRIPLGYSYEQPIGRNLTILGGATVFPSVGLVRQELYFNAYPTIFAEGRYYYNYQKRLKKGKNVANNSANYIALHVNEILPISFGRIFRYDDSRTIYAVGLAGNAVFTSVQWGVKRSLSKRMSFEAGIGLGVLVAEIVLPIPFPALNFNFGYLLNR